MAKQLKIKITMPTPVPESQLVKHYPTFISKERADTILQILKDNVSWATFAPSPKSRKVCRWSPSTGFVSDQVIVELVHELENHMNVRVDGVFLNFYQDGQDYCPYHRDQYGSDVYTLSLGDRRDLLVKPDNGVSTKYNLESGDLYFMAEGLHDNHKHSIPVRKGRTNPRISVVFFTKHKSISNMTSHP